VEVLVGHVAALAEATAIINRQASNSEHLLILLNTGISPFRFD